MTDKEKLDNLVAEIERRKKEVKDNISELGNSESERIGLFDKEEIYNDILSFYNSMQEEPKECMYSKGNYTDEDRKVLCEDCKEKCAYAIAGVISTNAQIKKEPVSDDLEQAIDNYLATYFGGEKEKQDWPFLKKMSIHFAEWQKEQFEKNRLKHCDSITNEQAELEQGFIDQHLDKHQRMPTFLDAIEYGMRLQKEQMMKDSVLCGVDGWFINNKRNCRKNGRFYKYYESTITHDKPLPMENGKDYRLITIKED